MFIVSPSSLASAFHFYKFVKPATETIIGKIVIAKNRLAELTEQLTTFDAIKKEFSSIGSVQGVAGGYYPDNPRRSIALRASDIHAEAGGKKGEDSLPC